MSQRPGIKASSRSARSLTCAGDSSALTSRQRAPRRAMAAAACSKQGRFADARFAADQGGRAGNEPAAEDPVELG